MKITKGLKLIGILSLVPLLAGCGLSASNEESSGLSAAWEAGYDTQSSLEADPISNYAEAFAYCSTMQESQFPTDLEQDALDYVEGCLSYVFNGNAEPEVEEPAESESDILTLLNNAGNTAWEPDKFQDATGSPVEVIYLGTSPDDGSICAVWVFDSNETAVAEHDSGSFNWVSGQYWYGDHSNGKGIVLIAESSDTECLSDAATGLEWELQ
jgi:hypothetical protein